MTACKFRNKHNFAKSLTENIAMFHKDCTSAYNKSKLSQKRKCKEIDQNEENGLNENSDGIKQNQFVKA